VAVRRLLRVAITVLFALSLHTVQAAPARTVREWRAAGCCATRCHHRDAPRCGSGCCQLRQAPPDTAVTSAKRPSAAYVVVGWVPSPAPAPSVAVGSDAAPSSLRRAGPIFLLTRTLRL